MDDLKSLNEKRAEIYWWLSSLFAKELSAEILEEYHSPHVRSFLTALGQNEQLRPYINKLIDALNRVLGRDNAQLELAADFCNIFLKSDKDSALPYASIYIGDSGLLNGQPATEMENLMYQYQIEVNKNLNEPADHIAVELDFLGHLIICSNKPMQPKEMETSMQEQLQFIETHLLSWIPLFVDKCQKLDNFGFYASVTEVTLAFIKQDYSYLKCE
ncbi:molecular chaperone TorD [Vibrio tetraodonis]|uniref:molecular chaperone TorD n=1 Tax=Vibrio tetraodonis TaxID=2231647 RepID=UPI000E0A40B2|nr:molecular chaperone TorD [Vibrio tetraodonis]